MMEEISYFILIHVERVSQNRKAVKCDEAEGICRDGASLSARCSAGGKGLCV